MLPPLTTDKQHIIGEAKVALFFKTPFCMTCQLAEEMIMMAIKAAQPNFSTYVCQVEDWPKLVHRYQVKSVPCLIFIDSSEENEILFAMESVTKIYQHYIKHSDESDFTT